MTPFFENAAAETKHCSVIERIVPSLIASGMDDTLHVIDGDGTSRNAGRSQRALTMTHGTECKLTRQSERATGLSYDPMSVEQAMPALMAAATETGFPIAGDNETFALLTLAKRIGASDIPVLVGGPTGTGKEVLARFLHRISARADGPFVAVNCAAMPEAMLEAMLFGHRKGSFTGASEAGEGFFRAADGGTLLLDEIGEMPLALQSKLLRALQESEVVPLGATKPVKIDVRIIACTNRNLSQEVVEGRFREDLLYRLNVFPLTLPALRERPGDIAPLAFGMLLRHACRPGLPHWISQEAIEVLEAHDWPGNVRELENVIRRAILLADGSGEIAAEHIHFDGPARALPLETPSAEAVLVPFKPRSPEAQSDASLSDIAFQSEAQAILDTLERCGGHRGQTARTLGISERTLRYRLANMREAGLAVAGAGR